MSGSEEEIDTDTVGDVSARRGSKGDALSLL